jgi:hypothetical protein
MADLMQETVFCNTTNTAAQPLLRHERLEDFHASIGGREELLLQRLTTSATRAVRPGAFVRTWL